MDGNISSDATTTHLFPLTAGSRITDRPMTSFWLWAHALDVRLLSCLNHSFKSCPMDFGIVGPTCSVSLIDTKIHKFHCFTKNTHNFHWFQTRFVHPMSLTRGFFPQIKRPAHSSRCSSQLRRIEVSPTLRCRKCGASGGKQPHILEIWRQFARRPWRFFMFFPWWMLGVSQCAMSTWIQIPWLPEINLGIMGSHPARSNQVWF